MTAGPLAHLRVVELCEELPAAYCGRQYAAWGADVLTVEPPGGSPLRRAAPLVGGHDGEQVSLLWEYIAANKRAGTADLQDAATRDHLRGLVEQADLFITDWSSQRLDEAGLALASLREAAPGLTTVWITPFGGDGPYAEFAGSDLVVQALSGMLSLSGRPDFPPLKLPANILPYACGVSGFVAALAALQERRGSGAGQGIEVACLEAVASMVLFLRAQYLGAPFPRRAGVGTTLLRCSDGYVLCSVTVETVWNALLAALSIDPDEVPEPLRTMPARVAAPADAVAFLAPRASQRSAKAVFEQLGAMHVVAGLLETPGELLTDPHLQERDFFRKIKSPRLGSMPFPGGPARVSRTPQIAPLPAPEPTPLAAAAAPRPAIPPAIASAERPSVPASELPRRAPLRGLRVLDLTGAWIGPYAAMLLADLGADVIKIEALQRPDVWRIYRPTASGRPDLPPGANPQAHPRNVSFYYNSVNLNKRGIGLDLSRPEGKALFLSLAAGADVVMENYTPRVMENFGLGYEALQRVRPDLVLASCSGYGSFGPYRDFKANGATIETIGGWTALFGYPDEPPMSMGEMEADPLSGLQLAAHTLVALEHRARTGKGQRIDAAMFEAAAGYVGEEILLAAAGGGPAHPRGNGDRRALLQDVFRCAGDDQWVAITIRDEADLKALLTVLWQSDGGDAGTDGPRSPYPYPQLSGQGRSSVQDSIGKAASAQTGGSGGGEQPMPGSAAGGSPLAPSIGGERRERGGQQEQEALAALRGRIERWARCREPRACMELLQAAGVPAGAVLTTAQVPNDPQFLARGWFRELTHADMGTHLYNGLPWRFSRSRLERREVSPRLGEHSGTVLARELGLDAEKYERLVHNGITGSLLDWPVVEAKETV